MIRWVKGEEAFSVVSTWLKQKEKVINEYKRKENVIMLLMFFLFNCLKNKKTHPTILKCIICFSNQREKLIIPCNHFLVCGNCLKKLDNCPVCFKEIEDYTHIFY